MHAKQDRATLTAPAKTDTAKGHAAPETAAAASSSDDDSSELAVTPSGDAKSDGTKARESGEDADAAAISKPAPVETDLAPEAATADSRPSGSAKPAQGAEVIKTTVAVKGSNRRIPKTIVKADAEADVETDVGTSGETNDRAPAKVATALAHDKSRPETTPSDADDVSDADGTTLAKSDLPSPAKSSSLHRKKSRCRGRSRYGGSSSWFAGNDSRSASHRRWRPVVDPRTWPEDWQDRD